MWFGALGPLQVKTDAGAEVEVGPRQRRILLCRLLIDANRVVSIRSADRRPLGR